MIDDNEDVQDPLKELEALFEPDSRQRLFLIQLPTIHAQLKLMTLHQGVPLTVRQLFETAKNVSLYSWFAYRFHQVSEMVAYSALELALRIRAGYEGRAGPAKRRPPGLAQLLKRAFKEQWITNEGFPRRDPMARQRAQDLKAIELWKQNPTADRIEVPEPTDEEIAAATKPFDAVSALTQIPFLRNDLAHGSPMLHPNSRMTLRLIGETINHLFPEGPEHPTPP